MRKVIEIQPGVWIEQGGNGEYRYMIYGGNGEFMSMGEGHRDATDAHRAFNQLKARILGFDPVEDDA